MTLFLVEVGETARQCSRCRRIVARTAQFCGSCGNTLIADRPSSRPGSQVSGRTKGSSGAFTKLTVFVIGLFLAILAVWYVWGVQINLITRPGGARISVDGKDQGASDASNGVLALPHLTHGTHVITASSQDYEDISQSISLPWNEFEHTLLIALPSRHFPLTVLTVPSMTRVQLDGKDFGTTGRTEH